MAELLKVIEVLAESEKSWEDAAAEAVKRAAKTLKNIRSIDWLAAQASASSKASSKIVNEEKTLLARGSRLALGGVNSTPQQD